MWRPGPSLPVLILWWMPPACEPAFPLDPLVQEGVTGGLIETGTYTITTRGRTIGFIDSRGPTASSANISETWVLLSPGGVDNLRADRADFRDSTFPLLDHPMETLTIHREGNSSSPDPPGAFCRAGAAMLDALFAREGARVARCYQWTGALEPDDSTICAPLSDGARGLSRPLDEWGAIVMEEGSTLRSRVGLLAANGTKEGTAMPARGGGQWTTLADFVPPLFGRGVWPDDVQEIHLTASALAHEPWTCGEGVSRTDWWKNGDRVGLATVGRMGTRVVGSLSAVDL